MLLAGFSGQRLCRKCGKAFTPAPNAAKKRYCSQACRVTYNYVQHYYPKHRQRSREIYDIPCKGCQGKVQISASDRGPKRQYCSHSCKSRAGMRALRARKKNR